MEFHKELDALCVDEKNSKIYAMAYSNEESFHLVEMKIPNGN